MFIASGISVDSWVRMDGSCQITCEVVGDEAQLRVGGARSSGLDVIATEEALENLVRISTAALREMRTSDSEPVSRGG